MTSVTYDFNGVRRSGRTCRLIENAPPNAYFIAINLTAAQYVEDYAHEIGRDDIKVRTPKIFEGNSFGVRKSPIVLDHNVVLDVNQYAWYLELLDVTYHRVENNFECIDMNQTVMENQMKDNLSYQEIRFIASQIAKADPEAVIYATVGNTSHYYAIAGMLGRKDLYFDRRVVDPTCDRVDEELEPEDAAEEYTIRIGTVVRLKSDSPDMTVNKVYEEQRSVDVVWFDETQQLRFCSLKIDALEIVEF